MPTNPNDTNTLHVGIRELNALLDRISEVQPDSGNANREFVRWDFRLVRADLTVEHASGSKVVLPVATRNLSRGGISILHSSFVHPGSRCNIAVELEGGYKLDVNGSVVRCCHIGGKVHELGIKFDEQISTKEILGLDPMQEAYSLESIDPSGLHGTVLLITNAELDQQILIKLLEDTSLTISVADNAEAALKKAKKGCELILTDYNVGNETAADLLMLLRAEGIDSPILVMTSNSSQEIRDEMQMSGASGLLAKPYSRDRLLQALAEFLLCEGESGPIYSTLVETDPAYEILGKFFSDLPRMILTIEKALRDSDADACVAICRSLANSAAPLGLVGVGELAAAADRALSNGNDVRNAASDLRQLIIACRRIRAKRSSKAA